MCFPLRISILLGRKSQRTRANLELSPISSKSPQHKKQLSIISCGVYNLPSVPLAQRSFQDLFSSSKLEKSFDVHLTSAAFATLVQKLSYSISIVLNIPWASGAIDFLPLRLNYRRKIQRWKKEAYLCVLCAPWRSNESEPPTDIDTASKHGTPATSHLELSSADIFFVDASISPSSWIIRFGLPPKTNYLFICGWNFWFCCLKRYSSCFLRNHIPS